MLEPFFMDTPDGRLFAVAHRPDEAVPVIGTVLFVPPFNEEANRSRSMLTLQAQALASVGFVTLLVDFLGTGDSEGHYRDGRWELWSKNLIAGYDWVREQHDGPVALLGLRLGGAFATELTQTREVDALVLWQAVASGKTHMTQFLRVRVAANLNRLDARKETTASLRARISDGETVEVAGYELHPELFLAIDDFALETKPPGAPRTLWLERSSAEPPKVSPAGRRVVDTWTSAGADVEALTFEGPDFWMQHDRLVAPNAIEVTTQWLKGACGS